jgi:hypothetical protein
VDDLFVTLCDWCERQKRNSGSKQTFGRDLRAALPWLKMRQLRIGAKAPYRTYEGIKIKPIPTAIEFSGVGPQLSRHTMSRVFKDSALDSQEKFSRKSGLKKIGNFFYRSYARNL